MLLGPIVGILVARTLQDQILGNARSAQLRDTSFQWEMSGNHYDCRPEIRPKHGPEYDLRRWGHFRYYAFCSSTKKFVPVLFPILALIALQKLSVC